MSKIYTHDEAAKIVEFFERILDQHNIYIPSPEDDERDLYTSAPLYGSTYSELLDEVEANLIDIIEQTQAKATVVKYEFSGEF